MIVFILTEIFYKLYMLHIGSRSSYNTNNECKPVRATVNIKIDINFVAVASKWRYTWNLPTWLWTHCRLVSSLL